MDDKHEHDHQQDIQLAILENEVEGLECEVKRLKENQEELIAAMKTGKGVFIALIFLLGTGGLALGKGIARLLGLD